MKIILLMIVLLLMLHPSTRITLDTKFFSYDYSATRFWRRNRQFFNYIRFHWWKLDQQQLIHYYQGSYISKWQLLRLWKWFKFDKEMNIS